jgi:hypothetical protein
VPLATTRDRRLNSLAFNLTTVDTRQEHGPFEVAPGTQWDEFEGCAKGMFPPQRCGRAISSGRCRNCRSGATFRRDRR